MDGTNIADYITEAAVFFFACHFHANGIAKTKEEIASTRLPKSNLKRNVQEYEGVGLCLVALFAGSLNSRDGLSLKDDPVAQEKLRQVLSVGWPLMGRDGDGARELLEFARVWLVWLQRHILSPSNTWPPQTLQAWDRLRVCYISNMFSRTLASVAELMLTSGNALMYLSPRCI